ncbi:hypothetical protein NP233_g3426 [Leucocoprinus birnbaumii]|uniref:ribonuclease H n=1 Tax=Leucocoprinus birnbaumii TaxID=56174 RepID=A0AAD5W317_9AGAR|nr:hypothetical protein NP233_g3426 [Leucocoprinus birnbaumii]
MEYLGSRLFCPPPIGKQTPCEISYYNEWDGFRRVLTCTPEGRLALTPTIAIFVDGSCKYNGLPWARAGMGVYFGPNSWRNHNEELLYGRLTSQRAEIQAAILALDYVKSCLDAQELNTDTVVLFSDSKIVVSAMTCHIARWRLNGWMTTNCSNVRNQEDFVQLDNLVEELKYTYGVLVKFWHIMREWNKGADREARMATSGRGSINQDPPKHTLSSLRDAKTKESNTALHKVNAVAEAVQRDGELRRDHFTYNIGVISRLTGCRKIGGFTPTKQSTGYT